MKTLKWSGYAVVLLALGASTGGTSHSAVAAASQSAPIAQTASAAPASAASFEGIWMGTTSAPRELDVVLAVRAAATDPSGLAVEATVAAFGALSAPLQALTLTDGQLRGTLQPMVGTLVLELRRAGDALEGKLLATAPGTAAPIELPIILHRTIDAKQSPQARAWSASLAAPGGGLPMVLTLAPNGTDAWAGAIDIPAQQISGLPLFVTRAATGGAYTVRMPVGLPAIMELVEQGENLSGTFRQGNFRVPIEFVPGTAALHAAANAPAAPDRPQNPKPPFPYEQRAVKVTHSAGHVLAGTLLVPPGLSATTRAPAVVLITGSGPQDRDEALLGHKPFAVLADALARSGIVVLRCDDRGVGESTGIFAKATTRDFATDAEAELEWLATVPEVDPHRLGLIGHSEGGLIAPMVAANLSAKAEAAPATPPAQPAFLVLMAGTGAPGSEILRAQTARIMQASGVSDELLAPARAAHSAFVDAVQSGADEAALLVLAKALVAAQLRAAGMDPQTLPQDSLDQQAQMAVLQMNSPWMRAFMTLDPREALRKVRVPVLVLNGSLDSQVLAEQNVPLIQGALKEAGAPTTVVIYPGLNHLFQPATTGAPGEYAQIETTIDPKVLAEIAAWVNQAPPRK